MDAIALPSDPERSTRMWLSLGWIPLVLMGIPNFFNLHIITFVGWPLEIARMSLYRCIV